MDKAILGEYSQSWALSSTRTYDNIVKWNARLYKVLVEFIFILKDISVNLSWK